MNGQEQKTPGLRSKHDVTLHEMARILKLIGKNNNVSKGVALDRLSTVAAAMLTGFGIPQGYFDAILAKEIVSMERGNAAAAEAEGQGVLL